MSYSVCVPQTVIFVCWNPKTDEFEIIKIWIWRIHQNCWWMGFFPKPRWRCYTITRPVPLQSWFFARIKIISQIHLTDLTLCWAHDFNCYNYWSLRKMSGNFLSPSNPSLLWFFLCLFNAFSHTLSLSLFLVLDQSWCNKMSSIMFLQSINQILLLHCI